jgi:hypothetical protein
MVVTSCPSGSFGCCTFSPPATLALGTSPVSQFCAYPVVDSSTTLSAEDDKAQCDEYHGEWTAHTPCPALPTGTASKSGDVCNPGLKKPCETGLSCMQLPKSTVAALYACGSKSVSECQTPSAKGQPCMSAWVLQGGGTYRLEYKCPDGLTCKVTGAKHLCE